MKESKKKVLRHVRKDARKQFTQISRETDVPTTTAYDNFKKLRKDVITRQVSLLDFKKLGYPFQYFFIIECRREDKLLKLLKRDRKVNGLFSSRDAIICEVIFEELEEKEAFKRSLENYGLQELKEYPILEEFKRECFIPQ